MAPIAQISPSGRQINYLDAGLSSVMGAREIITMMSSRCMVARLVLGLNDLGDDGTIVLFKYLSSNLGNKYKVAEISLNSNGIGDRGLLAITEYLNNNLTLKELFLQNNRFLGDPPVIEALTTAINLSVLETLSLTTNRGLTDSFIEQFLPKLDSPHLREIHLSAMGLTSRSTPHIIEFISSPRCHLHTFKCNGNSLGSPSVRRIIRAIERSNFGLLRVELYSNQSVDGGQTGGAENEASMGLESWKESEKLLKRVLLRNDYLKREIRTEALCLLRLARALLLQRTKANQTVNNPLPQRHSNDSCSCISAQISSSMSFLCLPTELQLHIFFFLAPTLSSAQRVRIYTYASSHSTLPSLLGFPSRRNSVCTFNSSSMSGKMQSGYGGGSRKGIGVGNKEEERAKWLAKVGCCTFEPERSDIYQPRQVPNSMAIFDT